jgi:uncharacterized membrane protein
MAEIAVQNLDWMAWNLFLAAVPLVLALVLFHSDTRRSVAWWFGVAAFVAFLPNAPYVLTDVVHFLGDIRSTSSDGAAVFVLIPEYGLFMATGLACYVAAIVRLRSWLRTQGLAPWAWPVELGAHALCAVGIYVGRFLEFNSWDLVTRPDAVAGTLGDALTRRLPVAVIAVTFLVLVAVAPAVRWVATLVRDGLVARGARPLPPAGPA